MKTYDAFHMENSGDPMKKLSSNGTDILDKNFSKYLEDVARLSLFSKFRKMLTSCATEDSQKKQIQPDFLDRN